MGKLLAEYQQKHPKVTIEITLHDHQIDLVEEGYDLTLRIATLKDSSLIVRRIAPCHRVVCASPNYLKQYGTPKTPNDLKKHQCLLYSNNESVKFWTFENPHGKKQQVLINGSLTTNNGGLICNAAINGMGIAVLPTFIAGDAIRKGELTIILDDYPLKSEDISLLFPSNKYLSAKVRAFIDLAVKHFRPPSGKLNKWDEGLPL